MSGHSELAREKMWSRIYLIPLLQAEADRDQVRRYYSQQAMEKELLGYETKVYHNDRYVTLRKMFRSKALTMLQFRAPNVRGHSRTRHEVEAERTMNDTTACLVHDMAFRNL